MIWNKTKKLIPNRFLFKYLVISIFVLVNFNNLCLASDSIRNSDIKLHIVSENAKLIIYGLEEFKEAHGEYPKSMDELVPSYINVIPSTGIKLEFSYVKFPKRKNKYDYGYVLAVIKYPFGGWFFGGKIFEKFEYLPSETYIEEEYREIFNYYDGWVHVRVGNPMGHENPKLKIWDSSGVRDYIDGEEKIENSEE